MTFNFCAFSCKDKCGLFVIVFFLSPPYQSIRWKKNMRGRRRIERKTCIGVLCSKMHIDEEMLTDGWQIKDQQSLELYWKDERRLTGDCTIEPGTSLEQVSIAVQLGSDTENYKGNSISFTFLPCTEDLVDVGGVIPEATPTRRGIFHHRVKMISQSITQSIQNVKAYSLYHS